MDEVYLAQSIKDIIEKEEYFAFSNFGYVVHAFTGIVPDPRILVAETGEDGGYDGFEVSGNVFLGTV